MTTSHSTVPLRVLVGQYIHVLSFALAVMLGAAVRAPAAIIDSTWNVNGNGNWNTAGNWSPGGVPNNNATDQYNVRIDNDAVFNVIVTLNANRTINNLTIDALDELRLPGGMFQDFDLTIAGTSIVNDGSILLNATIAQPSDLIISAAVTTLSGNGTLTLAGSNANRVVGSVGTNELIHGSTHTIAGAGLLGDNVLKLNNQGTIDANVAATVLSVDPSSSGATNTGTMQASGGGILRLLNATYTNAGGVIQALDGSSVQLRTGVTISGGTLATAGSGAIVIDANTVTLNGVTLDTGGLLQVADSFDPVVQGTITNNGTIEQNSAGNATEVTTSGDVTLAGSGVWKLTNNAANYLGTNGTGLITNGPQHTIQGAGNIILGNNQGTLVANQATPLNMQAWGGSTMNSGTLRAEGGATLQMNSNLTGSSGVLEAQDGSTVLISANTVQLVGDTLTTSGSGVVQFVASDNLSLFDVTISGLARFLNDIDPVLFGTITNNGTVEQNSTGSLTTFRFDSDVTLTGSGVWKMSDNANNEIKAVANFPLLTNDANHTIQGSGTVGGLMNDINNLGLIDANQATMLIVNPSSTATNTGTLQASGGGTLRLAGGNHINTGGLIQALTGSTVEIYSAVTGGTLTSEGTGVIKARTATLTDVTLSVGSRMQIVDTFGAILKGTAFTNYGTVEQLAAASVTPTTVRDNVTLSGTGVWKLLNTNDRFVSDNLSTLTNGTDHTIEGGGLIGNNTMGFINMGLVNANETVAITIDPGTSMSISTVVNESTGILRGTSAAGLLLNPGTYNNLGTIEALDGSSVTYSTLAVVANNVGGVLTGGTWRSVSTGGGATITLRGSNITQIAAGTEVVLSGAGSVIQVASAAATLDATLTTNDGTMRILNGRTFTAAAAILNTGVIELASSAFNAPTLTNSASGEIFGFGTVVPRPTNSGTIRAVGGTLGFANGIQGGSGTVQIDPGASLVVSGGSMDSSADMLIHNSELVNGLNLGGHNFLVNVDYQNANFGVGNAFNAHANVVGILPGGRINAPSGTSQEIVSSDVTNGDTSDPVLNMGNLHVGDMVTKSFQISNPSATPTSLRGALQTTVNNGHITDARLSGTGVTPSNFGPLAPASQTAAYDVTFAGTSAGPLNGQIVRIQNNFDNVLDQRLHINGAAYRLASASAHTPEPIDFGIVHVGDVVEQALSLTNTAIADGYSEGLGASIGSPTGDATTNGGSFLALPSETNGTSLIVGVDTTNAGAKSGTATITLTSDGTGTSGLASTSLASQTVNVQAQVNNFAVAEIVKLTGDGALTMMGTDEFTLDLGSIVEGQAPLVAELGVMNSAAAPADDLAGSFTPAAPDFSLSGFAAFNDLAAGSTQGGLMVELDDTNVGQFMGQITLDPQSTNPQPFSMDLDPITIFVVGEVRLGGDYNLDGTVNAADYTVWRNTLGLNVAAGTGADGSGPGGVPDGMITRHDFDYWKSRYGMTAGSGAGTGLPTGDRTVPEPSTPILLAVGTTWLITARRRLLTNRVPSR
jgi:hypothetical protein